MRSTGRDRPGSGRIYIGVDGGGSATRAAATDSQGLLLGYFEALHASLERDPRQAAEDVRTVLQAVLRAAGGRPGDVAATCLALAGVNEPEQADRVAAWVAPLGWSGRLRVERDLVAADLGVTGGGAGITVICGTGVAVRARAPDGRELLGPQDLLLPASAGGLGISAVQHAIDVLTAGQADELAAAVLAAVGRRTLAELTAWAAAPPNRFPSSFFKYAELAPVVNALASRGDHASRIILESAGAGLANVVGGLLAALEIGSLPVPVGLTGSVIENCSILQAAFVARLSQIAPALKPGTPRLSPTAAAVALAMQVDGLAWTDERWQQLELWSHHGPAA